MKYGIIITEDSFFIYDSLYKLISPSIKFIVVEKNKGVKKNLYLILIFGLFYSLKVGVIFSYRKFFKRKTIKRLCSLKKNTQLRN